MGKDKRNLDEKLDVKMCHESIHIAVHFIRTAFCLDDKDSETVACGIIETLITQTKSRKRNKKVIFTCPRNGAKCPCHEGCNSQPQPH